MRLSQALNQAVEHNVVPRNVCDPVKLPMLDGAKTDVWEVDEVRAFLSVAA